MTAQQSGWVDLKTLERQVREVEGIVIGLDGDDKRLYPTYASRRTSPGWIKGNEWLDDFKRMYPDLDVEFPSTGLTLQQLRIRYSAY